MNRRKTLLLAAAAASLFFALALALTLERGRWTAQPAQLENLNPDGEFLGPEGIQFDAAGNLYVSDAQGLVWQIVPGKQPTRYADLHSVDPTAAEAEIHLGGIAVDAAGNLYIAAYGFAGGSVLKVDAATRAALVFARNLGVANYAALSPDGEHLWVSDFRGTGRVLRLSTSGIPPVQPDLVVEGFSSPNGLALSADGRSLYVSETYSGNLSRIDLSGTRPFVTPLTDLRGTFAVGSLDGLAFDPRDREHRYLYVAENLRGLFSVVDLQARPPHVVKQIRLALMGGRPCPASMVIRDGYLHFTSLWTCNPIRVLLGFPKWERHAYRLRITDLSRIAPQP